MAYVEKRGSKYTVRYREKDAMGNASLKRSRPYDTKEEAEKAKKQIESLLRGEHETDGDKSPCGLIIERWFNDHVLLNCAVTTIARYGQNISILETLPIYKEPVYKLSPIRFSKLIVSMQEREPGRVISETTAMTYLDPLRLSLSWAVTQGIIPRNPITGYTRQKGEPRPQRILNQEDIDELRDTAVGKPYEIPFLLGLYGGLRREECAGLLWHQVDFQRGCVVILRAETRTHTGKRVTKDVKSTASKRSVTLPAFIMKKLRRAYATRKSDHVCVTAAEEPYALCSYRQFTHRLIHIVNKERERLGKPLIEKVSFHDLRHAHAAMLIRLNVQPKAIQERLGHASIKVTMDTYGYLMLGIQEGIADVLNDQAAGKIVSINSYTIDEALDHVG